jgi:hypothetical protein
MNSKQHLGMIQASTIAMTNKIHSKDNNRINDNNYEDIES